MTQAVRFLFERWARRAAWITLLIMLVLQVFAGPLFSAPRFALFDLYERTLPVLDNAARGHGVLSVDPDSDGIFRRMPLVSLLSGRLAPSLELELLRLTAGTQWIDFYAGRTAARGIGIGPLRIPTQADGSIWV